RSGTPSLSESRSSRSGTPSLSLSPGSSTSRMPSLSSSGSMGSATPSPSLSVAAEQLWKVVSQIFPPEHSESEKHSTHVGLAPLVSQSGVEPLQPVSTVPVAMSSRHCTQSLLLVLHTPLTQSASARQATQVGAPLVSHAGVVESHPPSMLPGGASFSQTT